MPLTKNNKLNKNNKNIKNNNSEILNVDTQHDKMLKKINTNENNISKYNKEICILKEKLSNENIIEKKFEIYEMIKKLNNEIKNIKQHKKNYLLENSKYVFDYFEKKKEISSNNKNDLNFFFYNKDNNNFDINNKKDKNLNINKYLNNITNNIDINNYNIDIHTCQYCNKGELIYIETDGVIICNNCYKTSKYYIENDKPNYREPPKEVCFYAYKRINHLREILAQFQAKETTQIPEDVIINIKNQIKKERIDFSELTNIKTKEILKNLKYNKYYEHIPFIKEKLGIKPPVMSQELEEKLCNLFTEIQPAYAKYCPKERVNFLNYYYTIYKLCELLNERQFLENFPMLKDREKRIEQDTIWKKICKELNWQFIPTI